MSIEEPQGGAPKFQETLKTYAVSVEHRVARTFLRPTLFIAAGAIGLMVGMCAGRSIE